MIFVVLPVRHLEVAEGDVTDSHIKEAVRHLHPFKACHGDAAVLVELSRDPPADAVDLHAVGFAVFHAVRQHTDEVADAAGRLQNVSLPETHLLQCLIHSSYNDWRGVKGGQGTGSGGGILVLVKQGFQFQIFAVTLIKAVRQTAPAHIAGQNFLFLWGGQTVLGLDLLQAADGRHIGGVLLAAGAVA